MWFALDVVGETRVLRAGSSAALDEAVSALASGLLVAFPTDTVFGLAADPTVDGATERVFDAKRRSRDLTLPLLADGPEQARTVAAFDRRAEAVAAEYWPGPLTVVLPRAAVSLDWDLGEESASVGVRVPDHPVAIDLLVRAGPLAVTSANISGEPTPLDCDEIASVLGERVALILCWGPAPQGRASTVVDLTGPMRVLREGEVSRGDLQALVERAPEGLE